MLALHCFAKATRFGFAGLQILIEGAADIPQ
jgi:hypothetical protein